MKYISLKDLRNPYPLDNNPITGSNPNYKSVLGIDTLLGKFNSNQESISSKSNLSSLKVLSGEHTFRFILDIDGELITSNPYLQDLKSASRTNNPYFTIENSPKITLNLGELATPHKDYSIGEAYAEVNVTSNINSGGDVLKKVVDHIDWLSKKDTSGNPKLRSYGELGSWEFSTTGYDPTTDTGMAVELTERVEEERLKPSNETT
jgi:hypothetical protein